MTHSGKLSVVPAVMLGPLGALRSRACRSSDARRTMSPSASCFNASKLSCSQLHIPCIAETSSHKVHNLYTRRGELNPFRLDKKLVQAAIPRSAHLRCTMWTWPAARSL